MTHRAKVLWRCMRRGHRYVARWGDEDFERCIRCGKRRLRAAALSPE